MGKDLTAAADETKLKVFVSYSRRDLEFAKVVADRLEAAGIEVLIDERNLPYGEKWKGELLNFIRACDTVLFIVSPHSIQSRWCAWEIEHTLEESKRLVPVVLEAVPVDRLPAAISDIHLLSFEAAWTRTSGAGETFDDRIATLVSVLLTDIAWLREHTRLADLARRWEAVGKRDSPAAAEARLLRGEVLGEAELWISRRPREAPEPTDVQRRFILASRRNEQAVANAETRKARQRASLAIFAAAILAVSTAAVFVLYSQSNHNLVLALLTKADQHLTEERPTRAQAVAGSMLASPLAGFVQSVSGAFSPASEERIRTETIIQVAGYGSTAPKRILRFAQSSKRVAFSSDGVHFAIGYRSGHILIDRIDGTGVPRWFKAYDDRLVGLAFSPDGRWLASATQKGIVVWELTANRAFTLCDLPSEVREIAFDRTGAVLGAVSYDGRLTVWQTTDWSRVKSFAEHDGKATGIAFSPSRDEVVTVGDSGSVVLRSTSDWSVMRRFSTGRKDLISVAYAPKETRIATAAISGEVDIWDVGQADPASTGRVLPVHESKRWKIRFTPDGRRIAVGSWDGTVRMWNARTLDYEGTVDGHDHWIVDLAFSPDSRLMLTASESGLARLWDLSELHPMFLSIRDDPRETLIGRYSKDGSLFVTGGREGLARVYEVNAEGAFTYSCSVAHPFWVNTLAFSPDSRLVVSSSTADQNPSNEVRTWDARTCAEKASIAVGPHHVTSVAVQPLSGAVAWANIAGEVWIRDTTAASQPDLLVRHDGVGVARIAFSPDGKYLAVGRRAGGLELWRIADRVRDRVFVGHKQVVLTLDFSPDGKLLASGGPDERILIWDLSLPGGSGPVVALTVRGGSNDLAFNADGSLLAVGSDASYIAMWSVGDWSKVFHLRALVGVRSVFGFHPRRGDLAFDGGGGILRVLQSRPALPVTPGDVKAVVAGTDVSFDRISPPRDDPKATAVDLVAGPRCTR